MTTYAYSEIFNSIQGEGRYTGVPTSWVRFFSCSLNCDGFGQKDPTNPDTYILPYKTVDLSNVKTLEELPVFEFGCDSGYSWSARYKHLQHRKTATDICDEIQRVLTTSTNLQGTFRHPHSRAEQHLCFTGGEPLMKTAQCAIVDILREFKNRPGGPITGMSSGTSFAKGSNQPDYITLETNGTQQLISAFVNYFSNKGNYAGELQFSVSPKLFTVAGEKRQKAIKPEIVKSYLDLSPHGYLKFVVGTEDRQWEEMEEVIQLFRDAGVTWPVWVMPVSATKEGQEEIAGDIAKRAYENGYNVSARVHTYLFGNVIGT